MEQVSTYHSQDFKEAPKKGLSALRIILIVFGIIIAVELIMGLKTLLTPIKLVTKPQSVTNVISDGSVMLTSSKPVYKVGEIVPITVKIITGGHLTAGVDLVLNYDPQKLSASPSSFIKGTVYDDYPPINIDSIGNMRISGVVSTDKLGFNGSGEFGVINFTAKGLGETEVLLNFAPDLTSDSNMVEVETNKDVLGKATGVKITIE